MTYRLVEFFVNGFFIALALGWYLRGLLDKWYVVYDDFNSDDVLSLNTWTMLHVWFRSMRISLRNKRYSFKERFNAWRKGLVRLPSGSIFVTDILLDGIGQMCDCGVPCEMFSILAYSLVRFPSDAIRSIDVQLENKSNFVVEVRIAFFGLTLVHPDSDYVLSTVVELKARSVGTATLNSPLDFVPKKLAIQLPDYVSRPS